MLKVCHQKLVSYTVTMDVMRLENIMFLVSVVGVGMAVDKLIYSIVFSISFLLLKNIVMIKGRDDIHIYFIKSVLIFLVTILCSNIIDIEFYKSLLLFYSTVSIIGINVLAPVYNKFTICDKNEIKKYKIKVMIWSALLFTVVLLTLLIESLNVYITYVISPIFIVYILLIIIIVKEHIIID